MIVERVSLPDMRLNHLIPAGQYIGTSLCGRSAWPGNWTVSPESDERPTCLGCLNSWSSR